MNCTVKRINTTAISLTTTSPSGLLSLPEAEALRDALDRAINLIPPRELTEGSWTAQEIEPTTPDEPWRVRLSCMGNYCILTGPGHITRDSLWRRATRAIQAFAARSHQW